MNAFLKLVIVSFFTMSSLLANAQLPDPGFVIDQHTAIVITDPQIDFLSPEGVTWKLVGKSVTENNTVQHIDDLFKAAQKNNVLVFVSPHYYYPHDHEWQIEGALEKMMHNINMFDRKGPLTLEEGSGADWMPQYKKYIDQKNVIVTSPHKVYGPETNDLALQLRKRGINKVILAGMSANLCTESHMRALTEAGFKVAVVKDATAAAQTPDMDGYKAALTNFKMISSKVFLTSEVVEQLGKAKMPGK
jgi:nicotinamidase-related amidase